MVAQPTFSTHDLRSGAVDQKRDRDHKHKWALGEEEDKNRRRPAQLHYSIREARLERGEGARFRQRDGFAQTCDVADGEFLGHAGDSSADEDVVEPSAAPEPDAEITYSFDNACGPRDGTQILGLAVAKAVERFENVQTEQLVKTEYELLDSEGEPVTRVGRSKGKKVAVKEDDDFELV